MTRPRPVKPLPVLSTHESVLFEDRSDGVSDGDFCDFSDVNCVLIVDKLSFLFSFVILDSS